MKSQMPQKQQVVRNMVKIYQSPVMEAFGLRVAVDIAKITQVSDGTAWRIYFNCYIEDNGWAIPHIFTLHSHVDDGSYIDAWSAKNPDVYDMLFSQLNVDELEEQCMKYIENQGWTELAEQEC